MGDTGLEGILEVFEFENKHVYCSYLEEELLHGLIKRGANVWVDELSHYRLLAMKTIPELKDKMNDIKNPPNSFDYSIALDFKINKQDISHSIPVNQRIILLDGPLRLLKWNLLNKGNFNKQTVSTYSVAPSIKNVKLVIPETLNRPLERYWSLLSKNPLKVLQLLSTWVIIKNHSLRKLFVDKMIVIK
tara:strand:+ start:1139 stop:1705 length:567 start_codon:yes stop_codon:yes gene_type:complete